ncbi:small RNA 2'-O-methyltransferase-like [Cicer arietinum]|uniref:Small RNA 2'-O-methyltransferase n=1 Tax=Cicer arietinum TaxID=3827 RepID=A0A1S3EAG6_CICAR|nr:small RNA 2'-O-methyltransferase-like [Cicer arietinum]
MQCNKLLASICADSSQDMSGNEVYSLKIEEACYVEYEINLTKVAEPPKERMEPALFSPPLSKQIVEFAVQHIVESHATTMLDFGCGSGSLLEALLNYTTSLEKIAGVDISQKGLTRAAKVTCTFLSQFSF